MKIYLLIFIIIFSGFNSFACFLKGNVLDSSSNMGIPYVTFYISDINKLKQQSITNEKGYFEIDLKNLKFPINISFKSIGYNSISFTILNCDQLNIKMSSSVSYLNQVDIKELSTKSIINKCLKEMKNNLYQYPFNFSVFYRKTQIDSNYTFLYSTEYFSNVYQVIGDNPGIVNLKTRVLSTNHRYKTKAINEGNWEVMFMLSYDLYQYTSNKSKIGIVSNSKLDKLNLKFLGEVDYENTKYYKIYYCGDSTSNQYRKGIMLINQNDFGLIYFSSILFINKKQINKREFYYNKLDDKYFLNNIKELSLNPDNTINKIILFVNSYNFNDIKEISNNTKALLNTSLKKDQNFENDSIYWKGFNYIPNEY